MDNGRGVQYCSTFAVSLAMMTTGLASGWMTVALPVFWTSKATFTMTEKEMDVLNYMTIPGYIAGCFITRFAADLLGRKATILGSALPYTFGAFLVAFVAHSWAVFTAVFLWGLVSGVLNTVVNIYVVEIADKEIRGSLTVTTWTTTRLGLLLVTYFGRDTSYKTLNYCMIPLPIIFFVICLVIPESPYFYLKQGKVDQAKEVLYKLHLHPSEAEAKLELLKVDVKKEMSSPSSLLALITRRQYARMIIVALGLELCQSVLRIPALAYYMGVIILRNNVELSGWKAAQIYCAVEFGVSIVSSIIVDRIGRKPLLITSFIGYFIFVTVVALFFVAQEVLDLSEKTLRYFYFDYISLAAVMAAMVVSTLGFYSVTDTIQAEIFPLNVKVVAIATLNILSVGFRYLISMGYLKLKNSVGAYTVFWIFAVASLCSAVFTYFTVPETKGKSLREIQDVAQGDRNSEELSVLNIQPHDKKNAPVVIEPKEQTKM